MTDNHHDVDIQSMLFAARDYIEKRTGRTLLTTTYKLSLGEFPDAIELPRPPLVSVTEIAYYDTDGNAQTVDTYQTIQTENVPACLVPAPSTNWPSTQYDRVDAVQVTYQAGYGDTDMEVPPEAKQAVKLLIRHWYDNPSAILTGSISKELELSFRSLMVSLGTGFYADV